MEDLVGKQLFELQAAAEAVGDQFFRLKILNFGDQSVSQQKGCIMKILFESHDSRHAATVQIAVYGLQIVAGQQTQQLLIRPADVLLSEMTGRIIDHAA